MIYDAINFLKQRLEAYLSEGRASAEPLILLSNPWSNNDNNKNSSFLNAISLINVEEEKALKSQVPSVVKNEHGQYVRKEPDIKLNLYLLISAYHKNYEDGLKFLSRIVSFFQANTVFQHTLEKTAHGGGLPENVETLKAELFTPDFEQQNQIWGSLSMGYVPSVIYKIRMIIVDSAPAIIPVNPIMEIKSSY